MPVGTDEFSLADDGSFILADDGSFGIGPECCCGCLLSCDEETVATEYAVAFEDDIDIDYPDSDHGGTCGGSANDYAYDVEPIAWDYTVVAADTESPCTIGWYNRTYDLPPVVYNIKSILDNGLRAAIAVYYQPSDCCWYLVVSFSWCSGGTWVSGQVRYRKTTGVTPAGVYDFLDVSGLTLSSLTYPPTITLS